MANSRRKDFVQILNLAYQKNANDEKAKYYKASATEGEVGEPIVDTSAPLVLAEDMSNMTDFGSSVADMSASALKSFAEDVAMGLAKIEYIDRMLEIDTFGIVKDSENYNGAYERIAIKSLPKAQNSNARNLISGNNYFDGRYYGMELDARVFSNEFDFKIPYSISYDDIRAKFVDAHFVETTMEQWRVAIKESIDEKLKKISDNLLNALAWSCVVGSRNIKLVSGYNAYKGLSGSSVVTWADIVASETHRQHFVEYVQLVIKLVKGNMRRRTTKYNDGTILMHTPTDKLNGVFLTEFVSTMEDFGRNIFHNDGLGFNTHETIGWQSCGDDLVPIMAEGVTSTLVNATLTFGAPSTETDDDIIKMWENLPQTISKTTSGEGMNTIENLVGVMYDVDMLGAGVQFKKTGVVNVGSELYNTYFDHFGCRQFLDTRGNAVTFTLD